MSTPVFDAARLDKYTASFERRLPAIELLPLAKILAKLRDRFGTFDAPAVDADWLNVAVRQAVRDASQLRSGQRLMLAFALAQPVAALREKCLLEREAVLEPLLRLWERDARAGAMRLSHWKGLFHSYMQAAAGPVQQRLGRLLRSTLEPAVLARRHPPAWLEGFRRHSQLLGNTPCTPYFDELMAGTSERLRDLTQRAGVSIPPTSWFWEQLKDKVLTQIDRAGKAAFLGSIEMFIGVDKLIPLATDDLIKALVERYQACGDAERHEALMNFALDAWGSPQLDSNLSWKACSKPAREMVCRWIAKEDLEQFYRLCKGDNAVDEARLEFWLQFQRQMVYTQILLGSAMRRSTDPDIRKFVRERSKQGRLGDLTGSDISNNAILMQIGGWLFVEFSKVGTACRCIRLADDELETGQRRYALSDLRGTGEQWVHMPSPGWQFKFLRDLASKRISPDDGARVAAISAPRPSRPRRFAPAKAKSRKDQRQEASVDLGKLREMGLRVIDNRGKGGALWAFAKSDTRGNAREVLRGMGFRYSAGKTGWYR